MVTPFKNKFVVNFHHADFDGAISGSCVSAALGIDNVISKAYSIAKVGNAVNNIIGDTDLVLLTDISVYKDDLLKLVPYMKKNKLIIYDHHINEHSKETFSKFETDTHSILDPDLCGSTITWYKLSEYYPHNSKLQDLEQIVYLSDVYDMWRTNNPDFEYASTLNDLLDYKIGYNPDTFRERFLKNPDPYNLSFDEKMIIERKKLKHYSNLKIMEKNAIIFDYKKHVFVMVEANATDYTKMHFMNLILETENVDMFIFKYTGTTQCSIRIPNKQSKIKDLNDWYEDFGCIGHEKAGGISVNEFPRLKKVLENI